MQIDSCDWCGNPIYEIKGCCGDEDSIEYTCNCNEITGEEQ